MPKISIILPTCNEVGNVEKILAEIAAHMPDKNYEVIYIDDGSTDGSLEVIKKLAKTHQHVKYLSFSRNFGHQSALRAGLRHATGDAVISMDADLQHPAKLLPSLIAKWHEGYQVVYTVRKDTIRAGVIKRVTGFGFYRVMNMLTGLNIQEGAADFRLLDRKVVQVINDEKESNLFLRGYIDWIGFRQIGIEYEPAKRFSGKSKYSLRRMFQFAFNGITQFSFKPLRAAFMLAFIAFLLSVLYVFYAAWAALVLHEAVPGWLSIVVLVVFMEGIQFLLIGLVGEYVGRTFMQTKHRPEFIIAESSDESTSEKS